jgi:hypothetical protein
MLSLPIRFQRFQAITGRYPKIAQYPGLIQKTQLSQGNVLNVRRQPPTSTPGPDQFRFGIGEALNHDQL